VHAGWDSTRECPACEAVIVGSRRIGVDPSIGSLTDRRPAFLTPPSLALPSRFWQALKIVQRTTAYRGSASG
jgi:hypothetical protein